MTVRYETRAFFKAAGLSEHTITILWNEGIHNWFHLAKVFCGTANGSQVFSPGKRGLWYVPGIGRKRHEEIAQALYEEGLITPDDRRRVQQVVDRRKRVHHRRQATGGAVDHSGDGALPVHGEKDRMSSEGKDGESPFRNGRVVEVRRPGGGAEAPDGAERVEPPAPVRFGLEAFYATGGADLLTPEAELALEHAFHRCYRAAQEEARTDMLAFLEAQKAKAWG